MALLDEKMAKAIKRLEDEADVVSDVQTNTSHRFPKSVRGITGEEHRYALPSMVAIGPWCNPFCYDIDRWDDKFWHLSYMDDAKWAAAHCFCKLSGRPASEVYGKVLSVVGHVRCYYGSDLPSKLHDDDALATTMFVDGCFLLQYMAMMGFRSGTAPDPLLRRRMSPPGIKKDIFMLENQIPYLVLEALMKFTSAIDVDGFIARMGMEFFPRKLAKERRLGCVPSAPEPTPATTGESGGGGGGGGARGDYKPPHLLELLLFHVTGSTPETGPSTCDREGDGRSPSLHRSAAELARIGVKLTAVASASETATTARLGDMNFQRKPVLFAELSLSPLFLDDITACWLVNMAALEEAVGRDFTVCSYLSVLAMLVDGEDDVRELRRSGLLHGNLSSTQALAFFKCLGNNLPIGRQYHAVLADIDRYRLGRSVRILVYKFAYDNYKTIAAVLSITGVLIGIFKTLLSFKHHN